MQTTTPAYYPAMNPAIFEFQMVKDHIMELYNMIYDNNIPSFILNNETVPTAGYKRVQVEIFGNNALIVMPTASIQSSMISYLDGENTACNCKKGTGCVLKSILFGHVQYCDATGCTKCTMSF